MSISNSTENAILNLVFRATAWANYADNAAGTPETDIAVGLHTGDPGDGGTMATSETNYGSYARVSVARSTGWTASTAGSTSPAANIDFAEAASGTATISHFSTGKTGGGTAAILWSGTVTPNISVSTGVIPRLTTATAITLD